MKTFPTKIALIAALIFTGIGIAAAQDRWQPPPPQPVCLFLFLCPQPSSPGENWRLYHESGRLGRLGLGASPFHPEGPGNPSF
jgi:hypothetical protein